MRFLLRLPINLYRAHLGWLLMGRFLRLTHTGRKSGLPRQVVLEIVQHDRSKNTYSVFAGFGTESDWVKNIEKMPQVSIDVGRRHMQATAQRLSPADSEQILLDYARRYPVAQRVLPRMMGYQTDGSAADFAELARQGIVFTFYSQNKA